MNVEDVVTTKGVTIKRKWDKGTSHNPDRKKEVRSTGHTAEKKEEPPRSNA